MNTTSLVNGDRRGSFTRFACLVATFVAASALVFLQPVFAHSLSNSALNLSPEDQGSGIVTPPSFDEPWDDATSSFASPALAPAPGEPAAHRPAPMFGGLTSEPSDGPWMEPPESPFAQPWVNPSISATNPMRELPPAGFGGF